MEAIKARLALHKRKRFEAEMDEGLEELDEMEEFEREQAERERMRREKKEKKKRKKELLKKKKKAVLELEDRDKGAEGEEDPVMAMMRKMGLPTGFSSTKK